MNNRPQTLRYRSGTTRLPVFLPDATRAVLKSLDTEDLKACGIEALMVNAFHLMSDPGTTVIESAGGVKKFMRWDRLTASDSGGFQLLSMIYRDKSAGKVSDEGVVFHRSSGSGKKKYSLTPESSIQIQFALGTDQFFCLDDCPPAGAKPETGEQSVKRTVEWGKRCRDEFQKQVEARKLSPENRPLLFAIIQGANDRRLREQCYKGLSSGGGFDGFGFGGWPLDEQGKPDLGILGFVASLVPMELPRFALGVGSPGALEEGYRLGYDIFDCTMPSRDARHGRLYLLGQDGLKCSSINIKKEDFVRDNRPVSESCDCLTCKKYSRSYVSHLFAVEDPLSARLSTIHNMRTWARMMERLRAGN